MMDTHFCVSSQAPTRPNRIGRAVESDHDRHIFRKLGVDTRDHRGMRADAPIARRSDVWRREHPGSVVRQEARSSQEGLRRPTSVEHLEAATGCTRPVLNP